MNRDILRIACVVLLALFVGLALDRTAEALVVALALYVLWQQRNLRRLLRWIEHHKATEAPEIPGVFEDICVAVQRLRSRYKKRKKKLSGYLKQFQQATAALPDATVVLDAEGAIQWANAAATQQLGVRWPRDLGQRLGNLLRHPEVVKALHAPADTHPTVEITSPVDAEVYLSIRIVPYGENQRLFVARDVTRLHRLNEVRRDFVANVSHELKTPLTVFSGYLESLEYDRENCPAGWQPVLAQLREHCDRMYGVVSELLLLSRLEQEESVPDPQFVVVPEMLGDIHKEACSLSADKRHMFYLDVDPGLWILGEQSELYSAFSNLVFNAVRYTPDRGVIRIRWYRDEQGAHLVVQDNGIGIPPAHLPRITERFYRVDAGRSRSQGGTGLGLAIVKHVLQRHHATLHVESVVDEGSIFRCDFPPGAVVEPESADLDELA